MDGAELEVAHFDGVPPYNADVEAEGMPQAAQELKQRVLACDGLVLGYRTTLWTAARVADLIEGEYRVRNHSGHVWKLLGQLGFSCQRSEGRARERNEATIQQWKAEQWPAIKKAKKEARTTVFSGESGVTQRPHRVRISDGLD